MSEPKSDRFRCYDSEGRELNAGDMAYVRTVGLTGRFMVQMRRDGELAIGESQQMLYSFYPNTVYRVNEL